MEKLQKCCNDDKIFIVDDLIKIYKNDKDQLLKILNITRDELPGIKKHYCPPKIIRIYGNLMSYIKSDEFKTDEFLKNSLLSILENLNKTLNVIDIYENNINLDMKKMFISINKKINKIIYNDYDYDIDDLYYMEKKITRLIRLEEGEDSYTLSTNKYCRFVDNNGKTDRYIINPKTLQTFVKEIDQSVRNKINILNFSGKSLNTKILTELFDNNFIRQTFPNCYKIDLSCNNFSPYNDLDILENILSNFVKTVPNTYCAEILLYNNFPNCKDHFLSFNDKLLPYIKC